MSPRIKTALKLLVACLLVGMVMCWLSIDVLDYLRSLGQAAHYVVENASGVVKLGAQWILLGAIVVLPIFLARLLFTRVKRRASLPPPPSPPRPKKRA